MEILQKNYPKLAIFYLKKLGRDDLIRFYKAHLAQAEGSWDYSRYVHAIILTDLDTKRENNEFQKNGKKNSKF